MKNKHMKAILLAAFLLLSAVAGCADSGKTPVSPPVGSSGGEQEESEGAGIDADVIRQAGQEDEVAKNEEDSLDTEKDGQEDQPEGTAAPVERELEQLYGNVKSIAQGSFVISQAFGEGENVMVAPGEGSEDETFVTVYVSEPTQYEVKTVKNGGVNGDADVEKSGGSFADLHEDVSVELTGYYEGEEFYAEHICVMKFV